MRRVLTVTAFVVSMTTLAGCGSNGENSLHPHSHQSAVIARLFWWMLGVAVVGLALVVALLVLGWVRRNRRGLGRDTEGPKAGERSGWRLVLGLGVVLPIIVVSALFVVADLFVIRTTEAPAAGSTALTIRVVGHQWFWEVRYPGTAAVTANEIHIPAATRVELVVSTADVIHSFWVPELNRKIDTIPGQDNRIVLYADRAGLYRGRCAEFCGLQHAHMELSVVAEPEARFRTWLAHEAEPARAPATAREREGLQSVLGGACQSCHAIRGTSASGYLGPDLTHVGARATLGAGTVPNTPGNLAEWIAHSQSVKPGNQMPNVALPPRELQALVAYLESLK